MTQGRPRRIAVLGAGLTGLAAAFGLRPRAGQGRQPLPQVVVFESSSRVGGKIRTETHDGVTYECGPDSFSAAKPQTLELVKELGLGGELLWPSREHGALFILWQGRLRRLPEGLDQGVPTRWWPVLRSDLLTWKGKLRLASEPLRPPLDGEGDESVAAFFARRLGAEAAQRLAEPLWAGAGDPAALSLRSACPRFAEMEKRGGLLREARRGPRLPEARVTLRPGLSALPEALARRLPAGCLRLGAAVTRLARRNADWEVRTAAGAETFDTVISALPAPALAPAVEGLDCELAGVLREIPHAGSVTVTLAYERRDFPHPLDGGGFLVPRGEGRALAAAAFTSSQFPSRAPAALVLLRGLLGGAGCPEEAAGDDALAARTARSELRDILGLGDLHPRWTRVARWPQGQPQYTVGHALRLRRLESCLRSYPGLILAGQSYRGAGLADCVRSGKLAAAQALSGAAGRAPSGVA